MLGVLLIYLHDPEGAVHPQDCANISIKPLTVVLQPINVHQSTQTKANLLRDIIVPLERQLAFNV